VRGWEHPHGKFLDPTRLSGTRPNHTTHKTAKKTLASNRQARAIDTFMISANESGALIPGHGRVHFFRPFVDASSKAVQVLEPVLLQLLEGGEGSFALVAV